MNKNAHLILESFLLGRMDFKRGWFFKMFWSVGFNGTSIRLWVF